MIKAKRGWQNWMGRYLGVVVIVLVSVVLVGGCKKGPTGSTITGSVSFKGKPVYPAKIMIKSDSGPSYSGNINQKGEFRIFEVADAKYSVAIEPIQVGGNTKSNLPTSTEVAEGNMEDSTPRVRKEDTRPAEFKNANNNIPQKYTSFEKSGLEIDCTDGAPTGPVDLILD